MLKNISLILVLFLLQNFSFAKEYKKITLNNNSTTEISANSDNNKLLKKIKLKLYDVSYNDFYKKYSIFVRNKKETKRLLNYYDINPIFMKRFFNTVANKKAIIMNAIIYDFYYHRPDLAENFYRLINKSFSLTARILKTDFLVLTGRADQFNNLYNKIECITATKLTKKCCYYYGLIRYLQTTNNRQVCFLTSGYKIAKDIYFGKLK